MKRVHSPVFFALGFWRLRAIFSCFRSIDRGILCPDVRQPGQTD
jgi:hypothetical protein